VLQKRDLVLHASPPRFISI